MPQEKPKGLRLLLVPTRSHHEGPLCRQTAQFNPWLANAEGLGSFSLWVLRAAAGPSRRRHRAAPGISASLSPRREQHGAGEQRGLHLFAPAAIPAWGEASRAPFACPEQAFACLGADFRFILFLRKAKCWHCKFGGCISQRHP